MDLRKCREQLRIFVALIVVASLAYAAPLFGGATFVGRDHLTWTLPAKEAIAQALRAGHIPAWWESVNLGVPLASNPAHSALYPPTWLVAVAPLPWGVDALLIAHVLFAGFGAAALSRRWGAQPGGAILAGSALMLSGFTSSTVVHGVPILTLSWLPWICWAADRLAERTTLRATLVLAAFVAGELLAGDPSFALVGGWLAIVIAAVRGRARVRALIAVIAGNVSALALAGVTVLPAASLLAESSRSNGLEGRVGATWSMHPARVIEIVWPQVFGDPNQATEHLARSVANAADSLALSPSWALSVYVSLPIVLLASFCCANSGRRMRWLLAGVAFFLVLAVGRFTPIYGVYRFIFLPERIVRYPEKYLFGAVVLVCAMAGVGWSTLGKRGVLIFGAAALALASAVVLVRTFGRTLAYAAGDPTALDPSVDVGASLRHTVSGGIAGVVVLVMVTAVLFVARKRPRIMHVGIVVIVGHLVLCHWRLLPTFDRDIVARPPKILSNIGAGHRLSRTVRHLTRPRDPLPVQARTLYESAVPNVAAPFGFTYLLGYDQGQSAEFDHWLPEIEAAGDRAADRFAADLAIVERETNHEPVLGTDEPYGPYAVVHNDGARPRAFFTNSWHWRATEPTADELFATEGIVLSGRGNDGPGHELSPCAIESPRPEIVRLTCDATTDGYAVLLDAFAIGWSATVDDRPAKIERAEMICRAVSITAGHHVLEFRYTTPGLALGAAISLLSWILLVCVYFATRFSRRTMLTSDQDR